MKLPRLVVPFLLVALGCVEAYVDVPVGPVTVAVSLPVQGIPAALLAPDGTLRRVACSAASPCPPSGAAEVSVRCADGVCALGPFTLRGHTADIDLATYSAYRDYANALEDVTIQAASIRLTGAAVGNSVGPLEVWWTNESAAATTVERRLGTAPVTSLALPEVAVPVAVDAAGVRELGARVMAGNTRFRVRLEGPLDVGSGAVPAPEVSLAITFLVHLHGEL
ncbi:MAG: hypothetical protein Q8S73_14480 [Deltaproteobacteria bacterium]|nr:hypothetical protein [Myxococcales bacterium]MDP3215310.1 hypothetical protein [Deltaproteobacteria bacterium]